MLPKQFRIKYSTQLLIAFCLSILPLYVISQKRALDSLSKCFAVEKRDSVRAILLCNMGFAVGNSGDYLNAIRYANEGLLLSQKIKWNRGISLAYNNMGVLYSDNGEYDKALDCYLRSLKIREDAHDSMSMALSYNNVGLIYKVRGDYRSALDYYARSRRLLEKLQANGKNDDELQRGLCNTFNNTGNAYYLMSDTSLALEFHLKTLAIEEKLGDKQGISVSYNNIGAIYQDKGELKKAFDYHFKSLALKKELEDMDGMGYSYLNLGTVFKFMIPLERSAIRAKAKFSESESMYKESLKYFGLSGNKEGQQEAYVELSELYASVNDHKNAYEFQGLSFALRDSLMNRESNSQIAHLQAAYESNQKNQEIIVLNKEKELQEEKLSAHRMINYFVVLGLLFLLFFVAYIIKTLRKTRVQKNIIEEQKQLVEMKQKEVLDSIIYAKRIQMAQMSSEKQIAKNLDRIKRK